MGRFLTFCLVTLNRNMFALAPLLGLDGKPRYFIGVQVDVTARGEVPDDKLAAGSKLAAQGVIAGFTSSAQVRLAPTRAMCVPLPTHVSLTRSSFVAQLARDPWKALRGCNCMPKPHRRHDPKWRAIRAVQSKKLRKLEASDFAVLRRIGRGDVGNVQLVRLKGTNALFAMKVLEKQEMLDRNKMHRVRAEDEILSSVDHPMVATLYSSFQTNSSLYFVMDYCPGGELFELLQKQPGKRFSETAARFYGAEVLLALQYLHLLGYMYRDLKVGPVLS